MNHYSITTLEALHAGKKNLKTIPAILLYMGIPAALFFLYQYMLSSGKPDSGTQNVLYLLGSIGSILFGLALNIFWRLKHSAAWKIWALENVQDVHRVFQLAAYQGLIYSRDSKLSRWEFRTPEQQERLKILEKRFDSPKQMENQIPNNSEDEQIITWSLKTSIQISIFILVSFTIIFFIFNKSDTSFSQFIIFPCVLLIPGWIRWIPTIGKPAPIRFNKRQLTIGEDPPVLWTSIIDLRIEVRTEGRQRDSFLVVEAWGSANLELIVDEMQYAPTKIEDMLHQYWNSAKQQSNQNP